MKTLLITILSLIPFCTIGQIIDELPHDENGKLNFSEVIQVESINENQLYLNAKQFFANEFKSANDVIQLEDKDSGMIVGKAFTDINAKVLGANYPVKMWFTIKIQCKEGRYKYEIYDIYYENYSPNYVLPDGSAKSQTAEDIYDKNNYYKRNGKPKNASLNFKIQTVEKIDFLKSKIIDSMNKNISSSDDNW